MRRCRFEWVAVFAMACLSGGCGSPSGSAATSSSGLAGLDGEGVPATIRLTGSSTLAPLMTEIGKTFEAEHPGVRVEVQTGGSSRGVADARRELNDLGMVSRELNEGEADLHSFAIARDGVCLIVHADNPVIELSDEQVRGIYTGAIRSWSELGGGDNPITVVHKAEGRSTLQVFIDHFALRSDQIRADVIIGDNEHGVKTVAGNPHAIGYVSIGTAEFNRDSGVAIKLLPLSGIKASVQSVASGSFPMTRTLNLVSKSPPRGFVAELIELAQSQRVHGIVRELSFVPAEE